MPRARHYGRLFLRAAQQHPFQDLYKEGTRFGGRPQNQRDVAQTDAETAEADMATAQDVPELPDAIPSADMIGGPMDDLEQSSFL